MYSIQAREPIVSCPKYSKHNCTVPIKNCTVLSYYTSKVLIFLANVPKMPKDNIVSQKLCHLFFHRSKHNSHFLVIEAHLTVVYL